METFVAVARTGSFAEAARRLNITASAASRRVTRLEAMLAVKLIHRTTRALSLTEAGEQFLLHAQSAIASATNAVDAAKSHHATPQGHLSVHAPMTFGKLHISPLVPAFLRLYPSLSIKLSLNDDVPDLLTAGLDVAITARHISVGSYVARRIGTLASVLCASPDYLRNHGPVTHPRELEAHNCLHYEHPENASSWTVSRGDETFEIPVSGNIRSDNIEVVCDAAKAGMGIARLPRFIADPEIEAGRLVPVLPDFSMPKRTLFAVYPDRQHKPAKLTAFLDFFIPRLAE
ncbi:MAG: LysR family transcriptional regulator [Novosphingobium sp.]